MLFTQSNELNVVHAGEVDFPTGEVVLADPLCYLGSRYETVLEQRIPIGSYPVELSVYHSKIAGLRIAAAKLQISDGQAVRYEIAMSKGSKDFTVFGVDAGLACFADVKTSKDYRRFLEKWQKENPGKNKYTDYFEALFQKSYEMYPEVQNEGGNFLSWQLPETGQRLVMFSSGMGDGIFSGYWGLDVEGKIVNLVVPFMNPEYF